MVLVSDSSDSYKNYLARQAEEIITEETDWVELATQLDVERYKHRDGHPEWHAGTPFRPMFLAYLWMTVECKSLSSIPDRLDDNPELARAFGFDPDDLPSEATCRPVRLRDRFEDLQSTTRLSAEQIRNIARDQGAPIATFLNPSEEGDEDDDGPSQRTIERLLRKNSREVIKELKDAILPSLSLDRSDAAFYDDEELLEVVAVAAILGEGANGGGIELGNIKNPDPKPYSDPFFEDGPTGETFLEAVKDLSVQRIGEVLNFALQKTYTRALPLLKNAEQQGGNRFGTRARVAIDITYVAYYGDREEMEWFQGAPEDKEYRWCHKFATITIVGDNTHYVVGVTPLGSTEYADEQAFPGESLSHHKGAVVRRLLAIADQYVNIERVYADREFHAADVIYTLDQYNLKYIIPASKQKGIGKLCDKFESLKRGYGDEEHDEALYVEKGYAWHGKVKGRTTNTRVTTNLVILPPGEEDPTRSGQETQPFLTNYDVTDETALDRRWARKQMEEYSERAAIEQSYTSIKKCAAWTTSKVYEVRWFHFAFACVLYNLWLLVDFLTQVRIGEIETRKKPRISLAKFLRRLDKVLDAIN